MKENLYTLQEIAEELGISEETMIKVLKAENLIDENGKPTPLAIENGLAVEVDPRLLD